MLGEITLTGLTSQGSLNSQLHNWRVGQLLEAVAVARPAAERLQLKIGNMQLEARTQAPIQAGDRVMLRVLSLGATPTLQVVPATVASGSAADIVNHTLRKLLPRQLPTERVLNNLLTVIKSDDRGAQLPPQTRVMIETLLARIPRAEKLADQAQLRQMVTESGLFREHQQQRAYTTDKVDIKQALVQLARQLAASRPAQPPAGPAPQATAGQTATSPAAGQSAPATGQSAAGPAGSVAPGPVASGTGAATSQSAAVTGSVNPAPSGTNQQAPPANRQASTNNTVIEPRQSTTARAPDQPQAAQPPRPPGPVVVPDKVASDAPASLQTLLQDVQRQVEGAIARIVLQQAQSMPQPNQEGVRWVFELPYRQGDQYHSLPMVIEREAAADGQESLEAGWQVALSFELPELGVIEARILVRGDKVSASLWAEHDSTARLADAELPVLETALEGCGLEVGALVCRRGQQQQGTGHGGASSLLDFHV